MQKQGALTTELEILLLKLFDKHSYIFHKFQKCTYYSISETSQQWCISDLFLIDYLICLVLMITKHKSEPFTPNIKAFMELYWYLHRWSLRFLSFKNGQCNGNNAIFVFSSTDLVTASLIDFLRDKDVFYQLLTWKFCSKNHIYRWRSTFVYISLYYFYLIIYFFYV